MVQQELHPSDEGHERDRDPGQSLADQTSSGVSEAVALEPALASAPSDDPVSDEPLEVGPAASLIHDIPDVAPSPSYAGATTDAPGAYAERLHAGATPFPDAAAGTFAPATASGALVGTAALAIVGREIFAWLRTLVSAAVYATLIVTFGFQVARVEGLSMAPTLGNQDRLIVNKFAYLIGSPRPGDIVMMYYPADPDKSFVKRVIAGPGDVVRIEDGRVYVNDVRLADDFVDPNYRSHDDHPPKVVEDGYYYVLGDHRNNSSDSREWGEVPKKYIVGKVQLRWWPIPSARVF